MKEQTSKDKNYYRRAAYCIFAVVFVVIVIAQTAITNEMAPKGGLSWITGTPKVVVLGDRFTLVLKTNIEELELTFEEPIAGQFLINLNNQLPNLEYDWGGQSPNSFSVRALQPQGARALLRINRFEFSAAKLFRNDSIEQRTLISVKIDGQSVRPYEFLSTHIETDESSLFHYYPFDLNNISGVLADRLGWLLLYTIIVFLLSLLITQVFLLVVSRDGKLRFMDVEVDPVTDKSFDNFVDRLADEFSIPARLLGTITSIWLALEEPSAQFSTFENILSTLQFAVFSTVLGLSIKVVNMFRLWLVR